LTPQHASNSLREVRLAATITFRGDTIDVQPMDSANATRILPAIEPLTLGPFPQLEVHGVGGERAARGVVSLAVTEQALAERRQISEHATIDIMTRRVQEVGIGISAVQALGGGRILMITPGLKQPERLWQLMPAWPS
jgi:preprotein translocase subunit SecD